MVSIIIYKSFRCTIFALLQMQILLKEKIEKLNFTILFAG
jgi:hypothetical protein